MCFRGWDLPGGAGDYFHTFATFYKKFVIEFTFISFCDEELPVTKESSKRIDINYFDLLYAASCVIAFV